MEKIKVGIPNEGEIDLSKEIIIKWNPTEIKHIGEIVFFKSDNSFFSMNKNDFEEIFEKKYFNYHTQKEIIKICNCGNIVHPWEQVCKYCNNVNL